MNKDEWKADILEKMEAVGNYKESFDAAIDTLADILDRRDEAYNEFMESGGMTVVEVTSDRGAVNWRRNPRLQAWMDLNTQALAFWRDLGLTPSGLKKINDGALKAQKVNMMAEALKGL